jgi:hypothetical protein
LKINLFSVRVIKSGRQHFSFSFSLSHFFVSKERLLGGLWLQLIQKMLKPNFRAVTTFCWQIKNKIKLFFFSPIVVRINLEREFELN